MEASALFFWNAYLILDCYAKACLARRCRAANGWPGAAFAPLWTLEERWRFEMSRSAW